MTHMHDFDEHLRAVIEDIGYWRAKRFEATVFRFARIGAVTLYDIMDSMIVIQKKESETPAQEQQVSEVHDDPLEAKVRSLELQLGEYIKGVMLVENIPVGDVVIDDLRKETGIYDKFFAIAKKHYDKGTIEERIEEIGKDLKEYRLFLDAFTLTLGRKGYASEERLSQLRETLKKSSPENGARIVARAWVDPEFKRKLLTNAREAVREFGTPLSGTPNLMVVEDKENVHNVIVCTLCSCYPYDLLGNPPWWYKHDIYKTQIVQDPRKVLAEMFKVEIPKSVEIHVHDSTSDYRYMVLPQRPRGTEGMSEEQLAKLVTLDSLIGTGPTLSPETSIQIEN
jgi:nitrile hydratase subunit alpha